MANCNKEFRNYDDNISIPSSKREQMSESRESSRSKIIKHFKEHHPGYDPTFWIQGSHKNGLNIRTENDDCDQDDGIHFNRDPKDSVDGTTLQTWVFDAVKDDTTEGAEHRNKCIRKKYKENFLGKYHIDYPVYYQTERMAHPLLAVKNSTLELSDPKEFTEWLLNQKDDEGQLVRCIKYTKGWCDYIGLKQPMPKGITMTVLVAKNISFQKGRDDSSLHNTLVNTRTALGLKWECIMPTTPHDDLLNGYDQQFKSNFLKSLDDFIADAYKALTESSQQNACELWKKHLGTRFPVTKESIGNRAALAGLVGNNKPYYYDRGSFL
ncbi:MAG TPA: CBASS cGAMP synthase [Saprospiraceae bacterium]|nr:CBASS cGAMP synthase [Saprospiraceae bacterium]